MRSFLPYFVGTALFAQSAPVIPKDFKPRSDLDFRRPLPRLCRSVRNGVPSPTRRRPGLTDAWSTRTALACQQRSAHR